MSVFSKIKKWLTKKPKDNKIKEANRVTNYGGGVSSKSVQKEVKRSIDKAEAKKRGEKQTEYQQSVVSKSNSSAFKAMPPSVKKAEAKDRQTSKKSDAFNAKNAFKASAQPKFTHQSTALGTMSTRDINSRIAKRNAADINQKYRSRAADKLKPLIDEKYSGDTKESKRRIKSGEYWSDPNVMKYETLKHPLAMSAGRGALSGTTFGLSELGIALLPQSKEVEEAERLYQANKNRLAEGVGELAGSLASFGLTSGASKAALSKVAPNLTAKAGASATERLAANKLVQNAAEREAIRKLGTTATKEEIERFARARAAKLVEAVGEDMAINLTTGAVSDVAHALIDSDDPKEFAKNMAINAGMNLGLGGLTTVAPALYRGSALDDSIRAMGGDAADFGRGVARNMDNKSGGIKLSADDAVRNADEVRPKAELPREVEAPITEKTRKGYHAGDKGKAEWHGNQAGSNRHTGHYGTGTYFAGSEEILEKEGYGNRPRHEITFDDYNMYRPKDKEQGLRVHDNLKKINRESSDIDSLMKRAKLTDKDVSDLIRQYEEATELEDYERIAEKIYSKKDREAIKEQAEERLKYWRENNINPDADWEIEDFEDFDDLDIDDFFIKGDKDVEDLIKKSKAKAEERAKNGKPVPPATYEQAYKTVLPDAIQRDLLELRDSGNEISKAIKELSEDLGIDEAKVRNALDKVQEVVGGYDTRGFAKEDSASTVLMKELGFEGVDVTGIKGLDNTEYGSVIYDLRPEDARLIKEGEPKVKQATEPKTEAPKSKKKKAQTREEKLANSNGIDQYNARAEHQAQRFEEGYEKADNIRAELEKKPAKGAKKKAETLNVKAEAKAETPAPKAETPSKPKKTIDLNESVGKKRVKKTAKEQVTNFVSSVKTKISDSLDAFEKENRKLVHSDHQKWLDNNGAIDKARRYNSIANRSLEDGQVKWKGGRFENSKGLKQIYEGMDESTEKAFDQYLLMKHAPDRIREKKPIFAGTQFDDPEVCKREAARLLKEHPEFAERAEEIYKFTRNELQNRVDAGLLKQEVADEWNKKYPFYVPTGRDGEFGGDADVWDIVGQLKNKGNTVGAGSIKKAEGGKAPIRSIKEQLAEATTRNWRDMSMNNLFRRMFGENAGKELAESADGGVERVLDNTINLSKSKGGKYFAEIFDNGEMHRVEIEKRFYDGIEDLYKNGRFGNGWDVLADASSKVLVSPFKKLVTSWNPIFMVKNGLRDFPEAVINSRQTKEFITCMPAAMKELTEGGEWLQAFRDSGVSQANLVNLEEALTKSKGKIGKAVDKFAIAQEAVETYPRLIEFMATVKKAGYNLEDGIANVPMEILDRAAANAADVTVNFGRSGSVGKLLNRGFVPFFNPSVQGWSKFLRNFSEQEGAKAYTSFAVKALALGAGVQTVNNLVLEDNPNYQRISARDKATNIIIPLTAGKEKTLDNTDTFVKIPKSRFAAVFSLPVVNVGNENKMGWAEMIKVTKDQIAPVDPSDSHLLAPFIAVSKSKEGKTWYGTPIVPQALVDLPKSEQYDVNTSNIGKAIGKATSKLPNELQISPKKADYIIDAETGVIGDFLLPMSTPSRQGGGKGLRKYATPVGNVLKKSFTIDSVTQNDLSTRFYDQVEKANTNNQSSKAGKAESDEYKRLNSFSTEVSGLNKAIKYLQGTKRETKLEDVRELQKFRNQIMQDAIDGKDSPNSVKTMNAVQKSVGTTYAINNFGSSADQKAMKLYGLAKYGDISDKAMRKSIDADKDFYKGIKSIGKLNGKIAKAGITSNTTLTKAVALASSDSSDELFGAYGATNKSRTESANKMVRARNYFKEGGSNDEYVKLETARRTLGKLSADDETKALNKIDKQLAKGEITLAEHDKQEKSIKYNANLSYVGLAASLAAANAPERGYRLYDIKDKNIQKGINLTAMGFTARDYKEMSKALDTNGNGYPSKQEIVDYVSKSNVKDKATLFDALYYYQGKSNPFGTPTNYTREQAALMGKKNGVKAISGTSEKMNLNPESTSGSGYRGYYRGGYRRWHSWGGGRSRKGRQPISANNSAFKAKKANISGSSSPKMSVSGASNISRTSARTSSSPKIDVTPLKIKTVKPSSARGSSSNLAGALEDIRATEKKVTPPKARKNK